MIGSNQRFRKHGWVAGTGLICLGAGGLLLGGCSSTATVSDVRSSAKADQEVASTKDKADKKTAGAKQPAKEVASKYSPGKARVTDLDPETRVQIAARASQKKGTEAQAASTVAQNRPAATQVAKTAEIAKSRAAGAPSVAKQSPAATQTSATTDAPERRPAASVGQATTSARSKRRAQTGDIRQTSSDGPAIPAAARRSMAVGSSNRPVITPARNSPMLDRGADSLASSHERRRADRLMQRAYTMFETGYREEALRLASVALELENSRQAIYQPGEERPSDFIALLQAAGGNNHLHAAPLAPLPGLTELPAPGDDSVSSVSQASVGSHRKPLGSTAADFRKRPALASVLPQAARDQKALANDVPHFTTGDRSQSRTTANSGQVEVPLAPTLQNADVSIVTAHDKFAGLETTENSEGPQSVVTADRSDDSSDKTQPPKTLTANSSSAAPIPGAINAGDIETEEPVVEVNTSSSTSQLTIASLIGLFSGVGGMFGLSWWRRQERQHYAAGR